MSYCVSCGVELSDYHTKCPLCQTPVLNPNASTFKDNDDYPDYRTQAHGQDKRVKRILTGIILSVQVVVYTVILLLINLLVNHRISWSVIPVMSLSLIWFGVAWPFFKKRNTFFRLFTYDAIAVAVYLFLLNLVISGNAVWSRLTGISILWLWMIIAGIFLTNRIRRFLPVTLYYAFASFTLLMLTILMVDDRPLALAITTAIAVPALVISLISYFTIKSTQNGAIGLIIVLLIDVTLMALLIDGVLHYYLFSAVRFTWSLIVIAVTIPAASTFYAVNKSREYKSVISRKLHR